MAEFPRITRNPEIMGGKACIRGMRVTVGMILRTRFVVDMNLSPRWVEVGGSRVRILPFDIER